MMYESDLKVNKNNDQVVLSVSEDVLLVKFLSLHSQHSALTVVPRNSVVTRTN